MNCQKGFVRVTRLVAGRAAACPARMANRDPVKYFRSSPEIFRLAMLPCVRLPLFPRTVEDLLHVRGIDIGHKTVRFWWNR